MKKDMTRKSYTLTKPCWVGGKLRDKGEAVDLRNDQAERLRHAGVLAK